MSFQDFDKVPLIAFKFDLRIDKGSLGAVGLLGTWIHNDGG